MICDEILKNKKLTCLVTFALGFVVWLLLWLLF